MHRQTLYEGVGGPLDGERHALPMGVAMLPVPLLKADRMREPPHAGSDPRLPWGPAVRTGYYRLRRVHLRGMPQLALVWLREVGPAQQATRHP